MRLINYGPGELSDRLSILALKILVGTESNRPVEHFQTEQTALLAQIRSRTLNGKWFAAYTDLAAVNAMLWHAEDDLREQRRQLKETQRVSPSYDALLMEAGELAIRIQDLNDRRAALVQQINTDAGEAGSPEKL